MKMIKKNKMKCKVEMESSCLKRVSYNIFTSLLDPLLDHESVSNSLLAVVINGSKYES